ncbi:hypothetical protein SDC9_80019 [bioreactor metagenome]|uniref:Uncharacterized protein n=1 Tax=bioreactor metagenome TaxID=1076179 RepID=A0A644Z5R5_9ZZZZ
MIYNMQTFPMTTTITVNYSHLQDITTMILYLLLSTSLAIQRTLHLIFPNIFLLTGKFKKKQIRNLLICGAEMNF